MSDVIAIASDHAGLEMKQQLSAFLNAEGFSLQDFGTHSSDSCDYPDYAHALAAHVLEHQSRGILICGSGIGMSIAANRSAGIRAALVRSGLEAELARKHNDANVLCLGARITGIDAAKECVARFLSTPFEGGRHASRLAKLDQ
jgi:ribose 5-phosphate isomerase B